jgi:hypothetical protein
VGKDRSYIAQKLRLLTLPAPILVYLERKALTEGHARQLLKIRHWLGHEITVTFGERSALDTSPPSDRPEVACQQAAWRAWDAVLCARQFMIPCWERAAFSWATIAVHEHLSVAELTVRLERWYVDLCYALCYVDLRRRQTGRATAPSFDEAPEEAKLWWAAWQLLRGAGLLSMALKGSLPAPLLRDAYARASHADGERADGDEA